MRSSRIQNLLQQRRPGVLNGLFGQECRRQWVEPRIELWGDLLQRAFERIVDHKSIVAALGVEYWSRG